MKRIGVAVLVCATLVPLTFAQKTLTLEELLSAPFAAQLTAAPAKGRVAWVFNARGRRNVWVAEPAADGAYKARQLTSYNEDDGQDVGQLSWSPDAATLVFTRGGDLEFLNRTYPNARSAPQSVEQGIWPVSVQGGEPKLLGEGHSPAVSPKGDTVAFISKAQVWLPNPAGSPDAHTLY